jgi:2-polyprenyl-6-methoxyphenol hydroxylase-like FAD-dependent oxidoreductase
MAGSTGDRRRGRDCFCPLPSGNALIRTAHFDGGSADLAWTPLQRRRGPLGYTSLKARDPFCPSLGRASNSISVRSAEHYWRSALTEVLVVGAGPVGLTLAAELVRHGIRCRIIEKLPKPSPYCRALGVTPRTLEVWDDMGIARRMIDAGIWITGLRSVIYPHAPTDELLELDNLPYSQLGLPQYETERLLTEHLNQFGLEVERAVTLTSLEQDEKRVEVQLEHMNGRTERTRFQYVVGCDGAHSTVRHAVKIPFEGEAFPMLFMLGDVQIAWELPRGMALRALRLVEDNAPDMFIAIPLPEPGRYRVSMLAPSEHAKSGGTDHGIQSELPGPDLTQLQAVADGLLPERPPLSDLRWSSMFRISMRLAKAYRVGRVFIAGDAAHIHPPTGGQGMNTGIQDAYNLAWKLALVVLCKAPERLLDSYEAERRPVGAEVVARTRAASEGYGREKSAKPDRLVDTQVLISYRAKGLVRDDAHKLDPAVPIAGDRAPDVTGLRRHGIGFPIRFFEILRGPEHVLVAHLSQSPSATTIADVAKLAQGLRARFDSLLRVVAIGGAESAEIFGLACYHDADGGFAKVYGQRNSIFLVRPDGYIGWRGDFMNTEGLIAHLNQTIERS